MLPGGAGYNAEQELHRTNPGDVVQGLKGGLKQTGSAVLQGADYLTRLAVGAQIPGYIASDNATRKAFAYLFRRSGENR